MAADTVNGVSAPLDITQPVTQFDVLSYMSVTPANSDWVVIDNQNSSDVYSTIVDSAQITGVSTPAATAGLSRITINSMQFPSGYTGGRFVVVPNNSGNQAVVYICSGAGGLDTSGNGTGTLYRITRPFNSTYPATCPATTGGLIVATNVQACNFVYNANNDGTPQGGFVWMDLQLTQSNESVTLDYGVHVDNVP